jgi:hypothetical protein
MEYEEQAKAYKAALNQLHLEADKCAYDNYYRGFLAGKIQGFGILNLWGVTFPHFMDNIAIEGYVGFCNAYNDYMKQTYAHPEEK